MNLLELKQNIEFTIKHLNEWDKVEDIFVLITLSESSIGSRASEKIKYVGMGMDWEHGQFRLEPEKPLVHKGNSKQDVKLVVCRQYDGRNYYFCPRCETKISKNDMFCRDCGQKLR